MPWYINVAINVIITLLLILGVVFINYFFCLPKDNKIEQAVEAVIEQNTGLDIDITP